MALRGATRSARGALVPGMQPRPRTESYATCSTWHRVWTGLVHVILAQHPALSADARSEPALPLIYASHLFGGRAGCLPYIGKIRWCLDALRPGAKDRKSGASGFRLGCSISILGQTISNGHGFRGPWAGLFASWSFGEMLKTCFTVASQPEFTPPLAHCSVHPRCFRPD